MIYCTNAICLKLAIRLSYQQAGNVEHLFNNISALNPGNDKKGWYSIDKYS